MPTPHASHTTHDTGRTTSMATATTLAELPPLISVTRAAEFLGISRASAYRYAAAGDLPTRRLGGRLYIVTARLRDLVETAQEVAA